MWSCQICACCALHGVRFGLATNQRSDNAPNTADTHVAHVRQAVTYYLTAAVATQAEGAMNHLSNA